MSPFCIYFNLTRGMDCIVNNRIILSVDSARVSYCWYGLSRSPRAPLGSCGAWLVVGVVFGCVGGRWSWVRGALLCPPWLLALSFLPASSPSSPSLPSPSLPLSLSLPPFSPFLSPALRLSSPPLSPSLSALPPALGGSGLVLSRPSLLLSGAPAPFPPAACVVTDLA